MAVWEKIGERADLGYLGIVDGNGEKGGENQPINAF